MKVSTESGQTCRRWLVRLAILAATLAASVPTLAEVYKYVDEQGNVTYSDNPPPGDEDMPPAKLPDIIVQPAVEVRPNLPAPDTGPAEIRVSIQSPENETTVTPGQSSLGVSASTSRPLTDGEVAVLLINGEEYGSPGKRLSWTLTELTRGEKQLKVQILDAEEKLLAESTPVVAYVHRPTVNRPK